MSTSLTAADSTKGLWLVEKYVICFHILHQLLLNSGLGDQLLSSVQLFAGFTNCDNFKLGVVVSEKDFSVETTVVGLLNTMVLLIGWSVI